MLYPTLIDFDEYEKRARKMSFESLKYAIRDCRKAIEAMPEGHKAGYYMDEAHIYTAELNRRKS